MKKLFTVITLLMSSFFLFSINKVSADVYDYIITDTDLSYLTDTFYEHRDAVVKYCKENNLYYIMVDTGTYVSSNIPYTKMVYSSLYIALDNACTFNFSDSTCSGETNQMHNIVWRQQMLFDRFLDSNAPELLNLNTFDINVIYNGNNYLFEAGGNMLPLYKIVNGSDEPENPFIEQKEMMNNFYSTIFIKIGDLATSFASNYIFLLIFGIFILIFVFELIRRRLL